MKKKVLLLVSILILMLAIPATAQAAKGSNAAGARLPNYQKTVTLTVDTSTMPLHRAITAALTEAKNNATNKIQYKVVIPPGNYELETNISAAIPSNTCLYARGANIKVGNKGLNLLLHNLNGSKKNIQIEGGTWNCRGQDESHIYSSAIRFAHVTNLVIKDMKLLCARGGHLMEFADIKNMTISGCTLSGNHIVKGIQPSEAIQLDVATETAMPNITQYNGKGCHNIIIENNIFKKVSRAIGSHHEEGGEKNPYTNITVRGNKITNCKGEGIFMQFWRNCTIQNNQIKNAHRAGIYIKQSYQNKISNNKISKISSYSGNRKAEYGGYKAGIVICLANNNVITQNTLPKAANKGKVYDEGRLSKNNTIKNNKKK